MRSALGALAVLLLAQGARGILVRHGATSGAAAELARMFANEEDWEVDCKIFAMWDYPNGAPYYIQKDLQSWAFHSKNRCGYPVLINDTNIKQFIPDLPDEYFRLPDHGSKSDIIRYALIYHNGGMYLDTDFLVVKDMDDIIWKVKQDYDLVSYTNHENCKAFSSNFIAGRKGSILHKAVWDAQKQMLKTPCGPDPKKELKKVCCPSNTKERCHIPWGGVGEMISHPIFDQFIEDKKPIKHFCFEEKQGESFVPEGFGTVAFAKPKLQEGLDWFAKQKTKKPMDRIMYHLFSSQGFQTEYDGPGIFDDRYVIGNLFRKSLEKFITIPAADSGTTSWSVCAQQEEMCRCAGKVFFGKRFPNGKKEGEPLSLQDLVVGTHRTKEINGEIACTASQFHGDPQSGRPKQCICQPQLGLVAKSVFDDGPGEFCANDGQPCKCTGKAHYGRKFVNDRNGTLLDWAGFVKSSYFTKEVKGQINCNSGPFGGDPQVTKPKQCFCQPQAKLADK